MDLLAHPNAWLVRSMQDMGGFAPYPSRKPPITQNTQHSGAVVEEDDMVVVPLEFARGVFWIDLCLPPTQCVSAVFDTGSSHLVVATHQCTTCDADQERVRLPPAHQWLSKDVTLAYGSQRVVAHMALQTMTLQGYIVDTTLQHTLGALGIAHLPPAQSLQHVATHVEPQALPARDVELYATMHMAGTTSLNIFGVAPTTHRADGTLLAAVFPPPRRRTFGILLGRSQGVWLLGPPPQPRPAAPFQLVSVPLELPRRVAQRDGTAFLTTRLVDVWVGTSLSALMSVRKAMLAQHPAAAAEAWWLMTDTGTTRTYPSRAVAAVMQQLGVPHARRSAWWMALELQRGVFIVLAPDAVEDSLDLRDPFVEQVLHADGILVGCLALRGLYMHVDVHTRTLHWAAARRGHPQTQA